MNSTRSQKSYKSQNDVKIIKHEFTSQAVNEDSLWYIEYDMMTLENNGNQDETKMLEILKVFGKEKAVEASNFKTKHKVIDSIADALSQIYNTLLNFFSVEARLQENGQQLTQYFDNVVSFMDIQIKYTSFFRIRSLHFRQYRLISSGIRLVKFLQFLYRRLEKEKGFDSTFFDNMHQVYLYIQQKVQQTIEQIKIKNLEEEPQQKTEEAEEYFNCTKLILVLMQVLNLLINFNGGIIRIVALNDEIQRDLIEEIQKANLTYYQYRDRLEQEHYEVEVSEEIDPKILERIREEEEQNI